MNHLHITVGDLIAKLKELPQDASIVLASDEEGNEFKYLSTDDIYLSEFQKSNSNGSFEAVVLYPNSEILEPYDGEDDEM